MSTSTPTAKSPKRRLMTFGKIVREHEALDGVGPRNLHRWSTRGVRGVVLASTIVGGTRKTSIEAVDEFLAALNASKSSPESPRSPHQRRTAADAAAAELEAADA